MITKIQCWFGVFHKLEGSGRLDSPANPVAGHMRLGEDGQVIFNILERMHGKTEVKRDGYKGGNTSNVQLEAGSTQTLCLVQLLAGF